MPKIMLEEVPSSIVQKLSNYGGNFVDNNIYFYSDVTPNSCLELLIALRETDDSLQQERIFQKVPDNFPKKPIYLHIHSLGGEVHPAYAIVDQLSNFSHPVVSVVEGVAASAASIIAISCAERVITPNSLIMIHEIWSSMWGKTKELEDHMEHLDILMSTLVGIYEKHSKLKEGKIKKMLSRDTWITADQALKYKMVDRIGTK